MELWKRKFGNVMKLQPVPDLWIRVMVMVRSLMTGF